MAEADYYLQVQESIKSIYDLTTRVDERVLHLIKKQEELERKIEQQRDRVDAQIEKVRADGNPGLDKLQKDLTNVQLEMRSVKCPDVDKIKENIHKIEVELQAVKISQGGAEGRWKTIVSFAVQIAWVLLAAYLLTKFGLQAPAVP